MSCYASRTRLRPRPNPLVSQPLDVYYNSNEAYSEWRTKWWREVVQNSLDARATEIRLEATEQVEGDWLVACEDNGVGMDESTLVEKFFAIGGSGKRFGQPEGEETIGGFGEAKKLIAFAWPAWSIQTRDVAAQGAGIEYELSAATFRRGTRVAVRMPGEKHTDLAAALELLQRSALSGVRVQVEGKTFSSWLPDGAFVREFDLGPTTGRLYHNVAATGHHALYVRVKGLYMFTAVHLDSDSGVGALTLDVPATVARAVLQNNRDGFRSWQVRSQLDRFARELAVERSKALKPVTQTFKKIWPGTQFTSAQERAERESRWALADARATAGTSGGEFQLEADALGELLGVLERLGAGLKETGESERVAAGELRLEPATPAIFQVLAEGGIPGSPQAEALAQQLVWQPAFMLDNEAEDYVVPAEFFPETMSPAVEALLKLWAEACRWVFMQLGSAGRYGVGFLFDPEAGAAHVVENGQDWLLLNPLAEGLGQKRIWAKTKRDDLEWLYAAAIHEVTHMANGLRYHDEAFAYALTHNYAKCAGGFGKLVKLAQTIKLRRGATRAKSAGEQPAKPRGESGGARRRTKKAMVEVDLLRGYAPTGTAFYRTDLQFEGSEEALYSPFALGRLVTPAQQRDLEAGAVVRMSLPWAFLRELPHRFYGAVEQIALEVPVVLVQSASGGLDGMLYFDRDGLYGAVLGLELAERAYYDQFGRWVWGAYGDLAPFALSAHEDAYHRVVAELGGQLLPAGEAGVTTLSAPTFYAVQYQEALHRYDAREILP